MGNKKSGKHRRRARSSSTEGEKRKHSHKRERSTSTSSSDGGGNKFQSQLDKEREEKKRLKKMEKQKRKEMETPEEKRARRLAKKMAKEQRKKAESDSYLPPELSYTNDNNPFNDGKLTETFVWGKKLEREGKHDMSRQDIERESRNRVEKNLREVEEYKRARDARRAAKEDMDMIQRDLDRRAHGEWDQKEAEFQLHQAKVRSNLRIEQNRAKPIDLLSRYIQYGDKEKNGINDDFELDDPLSYIRGLTIEDYEDLIEDIRIYRQLESDIHADYWKDVRVIVDDELRKLRNENQRTAIHGSVNTDVARMIKDKSLSQLTQLEMDITKRIKSGSGDITFWEDVLSHLKVHVAKNKLKELHSKMMKLKLKRIREEQMAAVASVPQPDMKSTKDGASTSTEVKQEPTEDDTENLQKKLRKKVDLDELDSVELNDQQKETKWRALSPERLMSATLDLYERGCYSPTYGSFNDTMPGIEILEEEEDAQSLLERRNGNKKLPDGVSKEMMDIARKGMDGSEATFSVEAPLETQHHLWSDKYRPRKPTYLNRVMTGFDWNKYNQTHYDMDNPPPKIVQGYKFNIFYQDLLDKRKTPSYQLFECDDPDFAEIRFHAGPPYEDIAFKIVNREWESNYKNGFKCQFHNGVFQLWFQFKKYRYRR